MVRHSVSLQLYNMRHLLRLQRAFRPWCPLVPAWAHWGDNDIAIRGRLVASAASRGHSVAVVSGSALWLIGRSMPSYHFPWIARPCK